jgi:flavin reductase (DIM6/NTAB) family NADH-FMN oxidoreductase RutF
MTMAKIIPGTIPTRDMHQFLVASVAPRPIAFVSTQDKEGNINLAPYSFFNVFSSNPPILVFSSNRRVLDNTTKDTLANIRETGECVINVVNYNIVRQMAVTSVQFDSDVNEFEQSGLTPISSDMVSPPRVKESPVQMECKLREIITLGDQGGAGHLIICDMVCMHIDDDIIDEKNRIDPQKIDLMGRLGRAYYSRAHGDAIHTIVQPVTEMVIGYPALPSLAKESHQLTANEIGILAGCFHLPTDEEKQEVMEDKDLAETLEKQDKDQLFGQVKSLLAGGQKAKALSLLVMAEERW